MVAEGLKSKLGFCGLDCWNLLKRQLSYEFHPARCALHVVSCCYIILHRLKIIWFYVSKWCWLPVLSCCFGEELYECECTYFALFWLAFSYSWWLSVWPKDMLFSSTVAPSLPCNNLWLSQKTRGATSAGMKKNNLVSSERQPHINLTLVISYFGERMNDIQTQAYNHLCKPVCLTRKTTLFFVERS